MQLESLKIRLGKTFMSIQLNTGISQMGRLEAHRRELAYHPNHPTNQVKAPDCWSRGLSVTAHPFANTIFAILSAHPAAKAEQRGGLWEPEADSLPGTLLPYLKPRPLEQSPATCGISASYPWSLRLNLRAPRRGI